MGSGRWSSSSWAGYASSNINGKSQSQRFASTGLKDVYDPSKIAMRESRDSADNPQSTPIVVASDVTGSMGFVANALLETGLNTLATELYDRRPVSDPHLLTMAVGDAYSDSAPLQVTQFEADIRIADQTKDMWLEGNGGGNGGESYSGAHLFCAMKTVTDSFEKRGRKGYLFTVGDEPVHDGMTKEQITRVLGIQAERDLSAAEIVGMVTRTYETFHIVLRNEGYASHGLDRVLKTWKPLLGERVLLLDDYTKLSELVVSTIQVVNGANASTVAASWSGDTSVVVANALKSMSAGQVSSNGIRRLGR